MAAGCSQLAVADTSTVKVDEVKGPKAGAVELFAENPFAAPITIAVQATLANVKPTEPLEHAFVVPAKTRTKLVGFHRINPAAAWNYRYHYDWRIGDYRAKPLEDFAYRLPYESGRAFQVNQGFHGKFSHTGDLEFAIDWNFPDGTPVHALRGGVVVRTKGDSDEGGPDRARFYNKANYVEVLHSDGTVGTYLHFQHDGISVAPGQRVEAGTVLGKSGHTGLATVPHLHFHVMIPNSDGLTFHTVPFKCLTRDAPGPIELREGALYIAP